MNEARDDSKKEIKKYEIEMNNYLKEEMAQVLFIINIVKFK
jgi:hypothetical protein